MSTNLMVTSALGGGGGSSGSVGNDGFGCVGSFGRGSSRSSLGLVVLALALLLAGVLLASSSGSGGLSGALALVMGLALLELVVDLLIGVFDIASCGLGLLALLALLGGALTLVMGVASLELIVILELLVVLLNIASCGLGLLPLLALLAFLGLLGSGGGGGLALVVPPENSLDLLDLTSGEVRGTGFEFGQKSGETTLGIAGGAPACSTETREELRYGEYDKSHQTGNMRLLPPELAHQVRRLHSSRWLNSRPGSLRNCHQQPCCYPGCASRASEHARQGHEVEREQRRRR